MCCTCSRTSQLSVFGTLLVASRVGQNADQHFGSRHRSPNDVQVQVSMTSSVPMVCGTSELCCKLAAGCDARRCSARYASKARRAAEVLATAPTSRATCALVTAASQLSPAMLAHDCVAFRSRRQVRSGSAPRCWVVGCVRQHCSSLIVDSSIARCKLRTVTLRGIQQQDVRVQA